MKTQFGHQDLKKSCFTGFTIYFNENYAHSVSVYPVLKLLKIEKGQEKDGIAKGQETDRKRMIILFLSLFYPFAILCLSICDPTLFRFILGFQLSSSLVFPKDEASIPQGYIFIHQIFIFHQFVPLKKLIFIKF